MYTSKTEAILPVIDNYLEGLYYGDVDKLRNVFFSGAYLHGDIKDQEYLKPIDEFLKTVADRQSPNDLHEDYKMEILGIEVIGNIALAKVHAPMLGMNYYDYLSLSQVNGEWKIVNKIFTHVER